MCLRTYGGERGGHLARAKCFASVLGGTLMIRARVRVASDNGSFTAVVLAESLREVEQTAKTRYPGTAVEIAFPIEPEGFFASGHHNGIQAGLEATEGLTY